MNNLYIFLVCFFITVSLTVLILIKLIPYLRSIKIGQKILDIGPNWHKSKEGTPTMCGVSFVIAGLVGIVSVIAIFFKEIPTKDIILIVNIYIYGILNALIGIIDDIAKIRKDKNQGLTAKTKFLFQSIAAILFLLSLKLTVGISTALYVPYLNIYLELGFFYYLIAYLVLCGMVNSVNLTDGIDGLASSVALTVGLFLFYLVFVRIESVPLTVISAILIGSTIGFLFFNIHPAKAFMGDTGSLFLGAVIASSAFVLNSPLLVLIYGFVFVIEASSDILQVVYFKLSHGKRIFKMAPLHHHFEKSGFSEMKIVGIFSLVNAIFCILAYLGLGNL
ncbi:MAG: phospho-N-acetylmuramoyl-pentapeptide-transferase [Clostridia bacterium]|nr:phospho-N-acetylmuramoyl-pentapeptide-transferase [Clostridia bacterium]